MRQQRNIDGDAINVTGVERGIWIEDPTRVHGVAYLESVIEKS